MFFFFLFLLFVVSSEILLRKMECLLSLTLWSKVHVGKNDGVPIGSEQIIHKSDV
jgi:hypothetical protein